MLSTTSWSPNSRPWWPPMPQAGLVLSSVQSLSSFICYAVLGKTVLAGLQKMTWPSSTSSAPKRMCWWTICCLGQGLVLTSWPNNTHTCNTFSIPACLNPSHLSWWKDSESAKSKSQGVRETAKGIFENETPESDSGSGRERNRD